jgi:integrase
MCFGKGGRVMATVIIQKRKRENRNSYLVSFKEPFTGKLKYYRAYKMKREAQQVANELRALLDSGKIPETKRIKLNPLTFEDVTVSLKKEWIERLEKRDISEKTCQDYCIWLNVLTRHFGKFILCQITRDQIIAYRDNIQKAQTNVSANKYLSVIKKVFRHGLDLNAVIMDVTEGIPYLSEKAHVRNQFLLPAKLDTLIQATQKTKAKFYMPAIIYLGAEHGASKQEILSLLWSDIEFDYAKTGLLRLFRTKNSRERTEFLMPRTKKTLLEWRDHLRWMRHRRKIRTVKSNHVFCRLNGTPIKCFNNAWWRALELAGIEDFHFHDLRHTFCSNLILSGAGLKEAKEMIGHADISMTDRYSHLSFDHKRNQQRQLADHYENGANPEQARHRLDNTPN